MEIKRADRTQRYGIKDNSNLNTSIQASKATTAMYDELTNSFLKLGDMATTNAIDTEIRDAKVEGEMKGVDAGRMDKEGSLKGYEEESEVFKWDVASNDASKTSFEANVKSRSSSAMKSLSKEVNGDKDAYSTVGKKLASDAIKNVTDEKQRQYILNSYAKSYNQNMGTVSTGYYKIQTKMAKEGWNAGRETFEEDYGVVLSSMASDQAKLDEARKNGETDAMTHYMTEIEKKQKQLANFKKTRLKNGTGATQLGAVSKEQIEADTHADIVKSMSTSYTQRYYDAETDGDKERILKEIERMPENKSASEETMYMSPKSKKILLDALDTEELREQKMWNSEKARTDKEYELNKEEAVIGIQTDLIMKPDEVITDIEDAFQAGYITLQQRKAYLDHAINGSDVLRNDWGVVSAIKGSIEAYDIATIADMDGLTDSTKMSLINERAKWDEEGEEWMTAPDYKEGKDIIRSAYRFPEASFLPKALTQADKFRYAEMQNLIDAYRSEKRESATKGTRGDGVTIAERLLKNQKEDITSKLRNVYREDKTVTTEMIKEEVEVTKKNVVEIMKEQVKNVPESEPSTKLQDKMDNPPEKTIIEEGTFPWSDDTEIENPDYVKWLKEMGFEAQTPVDEARAKLKKQAIQSLKDQANMPRIIH